MRVIPTTPTPAADLKGGDLFAHDGQFVEVYDTSGAFAAMVTVRYLVGSEVLSIRLAPWHQVSRKVA